MRKFIIALAALAVPLAIAPAAAAPAHSFERDGETYAYDIVEDNGATVIVGYEVATGKSFRLKIARGKVHGQYDTNSVSFALPAGADVAIASK